MALYAAKATHENGFSYFPLTVYAVTKKEAAAKFSNYLEGKHGGAVLKITILDASAHKRALNSNPVIELFGQIWR